MIAGGTRTNRSSDNLSGRRSLRCPRCVASATQSLLGRRFGRRLRTAHESSCSPLSGKHDEKVSQSLRTRISTDIKPVNNFSGLKVRVTLRTQKKEKEI